MALHADSAGPSQSASDLLRLGPSADETMVSLPAEGSAEDKLESFTPLRPPSSGPGAILYLRRIQRYSSYAFTVFLSIHLANTSLIPLVVRSVPASEIYLIMAREIYQSPLTEPLLVAMPVVAHVAAGVALRLMRRAHNRRWYGSGWAPVSPVSAAGYAVAALLTAHVAVNRLVPLLLDGGSSNIGLAYVAHGFVRHRLYSSLAYVGLVTLSSAHMVAGMATWLGFFHPSSTARTSPSVELSRRRGNRIAWLAVGGAATALATVWMAGALGVVARGGESHGWVGALYDRFYGAVGL